MRIVAAVLATWLFLGLVMASLSKPKDAQAFCAAVIVLPILMALVTAAPFGVLLLWAWALP